MNAVLYHTNPHKKINGTLFYGFEYFSFLKKFVPDLKYILVNTSDEDLEMFKEVFNDKYNTSNLNDIINLSKKTDLIKLQIQHALILDVNTYMCTKDLISTAKTIRIYSNDNHDLLNTRDNHTYYGWYDFQPHNIKTRIKLYKEIHKTFKEHGNKTLVTNMLADNDWILTELGIDKSTVLSKLPNTHHENLFKQINRIVYWHNGQLDKNNRSLIESKIHNIDLVVYLNGHENDSIKERLDAINNGKVNEYYLDENDILIQDFLKDCNARN